MDVIFGGGLPMKRDKGERLLAYLLWCSILFVYSWSLILPWFEFGRQSQSRAPVHHSRRIEFLSGPVSEPLSGEDAFCFMLERSVDGSFVGLAHPLLWIGWLLLAFRRWRGASIAGCVALACALNAIFLFQPREGPWFPPKAGYYLWYLSMALLASSSFLRNFFCSDARAISREQLERMAVEQHALAMQIDSLKQLTDEAVDLQAANILLELGPRGTSEIDR
jgi:hypothetical protein